MRLIEIHIMILISLVCISNSAQAGQVFYVLDTSQREQSELLEKINTFYRENNNLVMEVIVVDISPDEQWFVGEITYFNDRGGNLVANLKPSSIPSLLKVDINGSIARTDLKFLQGSGYSDAKLNLLLERNNGE